MSRTEAERALKHANNAVRRGDLAGAERWSKIAERMSVAAERLTAPPEDEEEVEARRAELRRRLALLAEADAEIQSWEAEREAYDAAYAAAIANNLEPPAPLRDHPAGPQGEDAYFEAIILGEEKP